MLYKRLIINGEEYLLAVNQTGQGAPSETTVGEPGVLYMDTDTEKFYKCTAALDGVYTWKEFETGGGSDSTQNVNVVEPAETDIPKVFITGVKPTTKDDVLAEMQYISKTDNFHAYLTIKCQGTSSMSYAKKNFTIKMFSDEARETKLKKSFKDWDHTGNKYVLKANFIDHSHARNIVSARLWNEVVKSRPDYDTLPEEMRNSPRNGAVDGFPIKVYYNGTYEGIYTWNIGKEDWQWGMDEDNPNHILLCAETNTDGTYQATPCNFRKLWSGVDETDWSVEVGTNSDALKTSLNNLIQFVMDNDGDAFRNGIGNYLDIQSAIDYYIFQYEVCGLDGLAKNMLLATYDGTLWRCGAYDLDSTFGLWWNGSRFVSATYACPEDYQEQFSLLWERIEANYLTELKARQAELRGTVLSYSNMVTHFERLMDVIGLDLYAEDLTIYTAIPSGSTNNIKQIRNFIRDRQAYVDAEFAAMTEPVPCEGIALDTSTLTFTAEGTQTLTATVTPDGCTDAITWESDNTSVATVNGGVVTAIANGSANITAKCGEYSASCTVAVSGIAEAVPCTGITLDKTELTFTAVGTQTLTATVTPTDTTDKVVWSSDNTAVSTVENGVVTAVGNGSANITATCGSQFATCAVSVSGIVEINRIYTVDTTTTQSIWDDNGEIVHSYSYSCCEDYLDIEGFEYIALTSEIALAGFAFYDSEKKHISNGWGARYAGIKIPDGAKYCRVCAQGSAGVTGVTAKTYTSAGYVEIPLVWSDTAEYSINTGEVVSGKTNYVTLDAIAVPDGAIAVRFRNVNDSTFQYQGVARYSDDMSLIKYDEGDTTTTERWVALDYSIKYVRFSAYPNNNSANVPATGLVAEFLL